MRVRNPVLESMEQEQREADHRATSTATVMLGLLFTVIVAYELACIITG